MDIYDEGGLEGLRETTKLLEDAEKLGKQVRKYNRLKRHVRSRGVERTGRIIGEDTLTSYELRQSLWPVGDLLKSGVVTLGKHNQVQIDTEFKKWLDKLLTFLEKREEIQESSKQKS
jgi:hypothetical protein